MVPPTGLPNLLVVLVPICVVDVSGIDDHIELQNDLLATLWEHHYAQNWHGEVIISIQNEAARLGRHDPLKEGSDRSKFTLSRRSNLKSSQELFEFCRNSSATGILTFFVRIDWAAAVTGAASFSARSLFACTKIPSKPGLERLVITIVSRKDQKQLCLVRLKGATAIGSILNCIVHELQFNQYYLKPGERTDLASAHKAIPEEVHKDFDFVDHFREDIDSNCHLILSVNAFQARPANKVILRSLSQVYEIPNVVGQVKFPRMIVKIYARRESELACTVDLTGINDPKNLRQRINRALMESAYLIRGQLVLTEKDCSITTSYEPLTDQQLFYLCYNKGDLTGTLGLFAEVSKVIFAKEYCPEDDWRKLSEIRVKIIDWASGEDYGYVEYNGHITPDDCYMHLTYKVEEYTKKAAKIIFGSGPDFLFALSEDVLYKVLHEKGDKKGSLAISVILGGSVENRSWNRICCLHCHDNK